MKMAWSIFLAMVFVFMTFLLGEVSFGPAGSYKFFCASVLTVLLFAVYVFLFYFGFAREFNGFSLRNIFRFLVSLLVGFGFVSMGMLARIAENDFSMQAFRISWAGVFLVALLIAGVFFNSDLLKKREGNI